MEIKVLDLCVVDENKNVYQTSEEELFGVDNYDFEDDYDEYDYDEYDYEPLEGWDRYIENINNGNLDDINIDIDEVDKDVFIIDDGGELIRLKDSSYLEVCWRGNCCRVWNEDDEERISYFNNKLKEEEN